MYCMTLNSKPKPKYYRGGFDSFFGFTQNKEEIPTLFGYLKCTLCHQFPHPDYLLVCMLNHHYVCGLCAWPKDPEKDEREPCCEPDCLKKWRCPILENFLHCGIWECENKNKGKKCKKVLTGHEVMEHHLNCDAIKPPPKKPEIRCHFVACGKKLWDQEDLIRHLIKEHKFDVGVKDLTGKSSCVLEFFDGISLLSIDENTRRRQYYLVKKEKAVYLVVGMLLIDILYIWVWDLDVKFLKITDELSETTYGISFKSPVHPEEAHQFRGMCVPYWRRCQAIVDSGNCLALPARYVIRKYVFPECGPPNSKDDPGIEFEFSVDTATTAPEPELQENSGPEAGADN